MRKLIPFFLVSILIAIAVALLVDVARLFQILQPIVVCLSIMAAAIFVRLNRGFPTLEWKSLKPHQRKELTLAVLLLAKDYVLGLVLTFTSIVLLVLISAVGAKDAATLGEMWQWKFLFLFTLSLCLSVTWMGYLVWRDYDIVRLQKTIIDDAADRELAEINQQEAEKKKSAMKAAAVSALPVSTTEWPKN
jgi:hypothetical protein